MTDPVRLHVDSDPGIDDGVALAVAAAAHRSGRAEVVSVTTVAGNVAVDLTTGNARFLLDRFGLDRIPVVRGAEGPIGAPVPADAIGFHGADGLAGLNSGDHGPVPDDGDPIAALTEGAAEGGVLVALGPLTNLAAALRRDPHRIDGYERVVSMGGAFGDPSGNVTEHAEFNVYADALAADEVLGILGPRLTMVPLDVTRRVLLTAEDADRVADDPGDGLVERLLRAGVAGQRRVTELPGMAAHDPLAMAVALDPTLVEVADLVVSVPHTGERRGECQVGVAADGRSPVGVALAVDVERAREAVLGPLTP